MTDAEILTILSKRHVKVLDELEHARRLSVLHQQNLEAELASWRRNPTNIQVELDRRGYAVYDGPGAA